MNDFKINPLSRSGTYSSLFTDAPDSPTSISDFESDSEEEVGKKRKARSLAKSHPLQEPLNNQTLKRARLIKGELPSSIHTYLLIADFHKALKTLKKKPTSATCIERGSKNSTLISLTKVIWEKEEFCLLFQNLLRRGADPFCHNQLGRNFIHYAASYPDISCEEWDFILKTLQKKNSKGIYSVDKSGMSPIEHLIQEHFRTPPELLERAVIYLKYLKPEEKKIEIRNLLKEVFDDDLSFSNPKKLVDFLNGLNQSEPISRQVSEFLTKGGNNAFHQALEMFADYLDNHEADSFEDLLRLLYTYNVDINHQNNDEVTPFLTCIQTNISFRKKFRILKIFDEFNADPFICCEKTSKGNPIPSFETVFIQLLRLRHSKEEIHQIMVHFFSKDYFNEFLHLSLLANIFEIEILWEVDGYKVDLIGVSNSNRFLENCLQHECLDFYEVLSSDDEEASALYDFISKDTSNILGKIYDVEGDEEKEAEEEEPKDVLDQFFTKIGVTLSQAFSNNRTHSRSFLYPSEISKKVHPDETSESESVALMKSFKTKTEDRHHVGFLLTRSGIYIGNDGYAAGPFPGVSHHPLSTRSELKKMVTEIQKTREAEEFFQEFFPSRFFEKKTETPTIIHNEPQTVGNCTIKSFAAIEKAALYREGKKAFGNILKESEIIDFSIEIQDLHLHRQRRFFLQKYLEEQERSSDFEPYMPLLAAISLEYHAASPPYNFLKTISLWLRDNKSEKIQLRFIEELLALVPLDDEIMDEVFVYLPSLENKYRQSPLDKLVDAAKDSYKDFIDFCFSPYSASIIEPEPASSPPTPPYGAESWEGAYPLDSLMIGTSEAYKELFPGLNPEKADQTFGE